MNINPFIFRAYDIRGIAEHDTGDDPDLSPEAMYAIGRGFGTYMRRKNRGSQFMVGKDNRTSGKILQESFVAGLLATGCDVMYVEYASSPMIYWASCVYDIDGGVNITASHNPKEYNGAKFVGKNAHSICGNELQEILEIITNDDFLDGQRQGTLSKKEIFTDYKNDIITRVKLSRPLTVVIDAGNGVTGAFAPTLFRELGCKVIELYCELDGTFPNHEANPEVEANLKMLQERVISEKADLGIAFDGDGDRVGIIDAQGKFYSADLLLIPLARHLLEHNPGASIIFDIKTSKVIEDDITAHGGIPIRYKTGHSFIESKMHETKAILGGETSGHLFFADNWYGFDDGMYAAARIVELVSRKGVPFSDLFTDVPHAYNTPEWKVPCSDHAKFRVAEDVKDFFVKRYPCITIDGVWIDFGKNSWGAVRASNTSPCLTLRFEARDAKQLDLVTRIVVDKLKEYPEVEIRD